MHATIRRYEGIDQDRTEELTKKVGESLLPRLSEMPGFKSYHLIEADKGVMSSIALLRHVGAGRRVDPRRSHLGARGEAGDGTSESAQGHGRRSDRGENVRKRTDSSARNPDRSKGRPAPRAFPVPSTLFCTSLC